MSNSTRRPASGVVGVSRRRARAGAAEARGRVGLAPAADHAHLVRTRDRQRRRRAQRGEQLAVLAVVAGPLAVLEVGEPGELREIDHRRVRQPADHLAREIALDLLGPELVHELLQQLARFGAARRAHADRGEQEAIALGDDDVQADVAGDEVLELVAHGADQRRVDAEVGAGAQGIGGGAGVAVARRGVDVEVGLVQVARVARRQVAAAGDAMEDPRFHGHDGLSLSVRD
jgi:hypothetical protein